MFDHLWQIHIIVLRWPYLLWLIPSGFSTGASTLTSLLRLCMKQYTKLTYGRYSICDYYYRGHFTNYQGWKESSSVVVASFCSQICERPNADPVSRPLGSFKFLVWPLLGDKMTGSDQNLTLDVVVSYRKINWWKNKEFDVFKQAVSDVINRLEHSTAMIFWNKVLRLAVADHVNSIKQLEWFICIAYPIRYS